MRRLPWGAQPWSAEMTERYRALVESVESRKPAGEPRARTELEQLQELCAFVSEPLTTQESLEDLRARIDLLRLVVLRSAELSSDLYQSALFILGAVLLRSCQASAANQSTDDADEAIWCLTELLDHDRDPQRRILVQMQLPALQFHQYSQGPREVRWVEAAVASYRGALETLISADVRGDVLHASCWTAVPHILENMVGAVGEWLDRGGPTVALPELLQIADRAVSALSAHGEQHSPLVRESAKFYGNLALLIDERTGLDVSDSLIAALRHLLHATPTHHPEVRAFQGKLGRLLIERNARTADTADLDEAIQVLREATQGTENSPNLRVEFFLMLAYALGSRAQLAPDPADLDEAIASYRIVFRHTSDQLTKDTSIDRLCGLLVVRYRVAGHLSDLDETIKLHFDAQKDHQGAPHTAPGARAAATALQYRAEATGDRSDSHLAHLMRLAGTAADKDRPVRRRGMMRTFFGLPYFQLVSMADPSTLTSLLDEIDEQSVLLRTAIAEATGPDRLALLDELVEGLSAQALVAPTGQLSDELIDRLRELVQCIPPGDDLHRSAHEAGLGIALHQRYEQRRESGDLDEALRWLGRAVSVDSTPTIFRITTAKLAGWHAANAGRWNDALDAYRLAVSLLPRLAARDLGRADHLAHLSMFGGLAGDAAAVAIRRADPAGALELLEQGRGLLIGYALDYRSDLAKLAEAEPSLADELRRIGDQLATEADPHAYAEPSPGRESVTDQRHRLARRWDQLVEQIRGLPEFADFFAPPRVADLVGAARSGPVVVVNLSRHGCDALVVTSNGVELVPLPKLSIEDADRHATSFQSLVPFAELVPGDLDATEAAQEPLRQTLGWLWDTVAAPVFVHLDARGHSTERLWWIPTGSLTALPLHAAGRVGAVGVLDRTVSSYAPTIRTLRAAQRSRDDAPPSAAAERTVGTARIIAVAEAPQLASLAGAVAEAGRLAERFPEFDGSHGAAATRADALAALDHSTWVHIACHASTYAGYPIKSALHLADGPLTVGELLVSRPAGGRVVYLSGCETALAGSSVADEVIHLGSALQIVGFPHVVGTLWRVTDGTAAEAARLVYQELDSGLDEDRLPTAVHAAALSLRQRYPTLPTRWASYLHIGP